LRVFLLAGFLGALAALVVAARAAGFSFAAGGKADLGAARNDRA